MGTGCCPRLSVDWGSAFVQPLLTPFEASITFKVATIGGDYPMHFYQFYTNTSLGPWTVNNAAHKPVGNNDVC